MKRMRIASVVFSVLGLAGSAHASDPGWVAKSLEPAGASQSKCFGASNGVQCGFVNFTGQGSATIWHGTAGSCVDLSVGQGSWISSAANAISGDQVVISPFTSNMGRAILYSISAHTYLDLTPSGYSSAAMQGCFEGTNSQVGGGQQMMGAMLLWHGTPESAVNLTPPGWVSSAAAGCAGDTQVGNGLPGFMGFGHPFLTHGTPESYVDLTPPGSTSAGVAGCDLTSQVGSVLWPSVMQGHACLWHGDAASCVDLNPFSAASSAAAACGHDMQAGAYMASTGFGHAVVWRGTASSAEDLHHAIETNLGSQYVQSEATAIDAVTGDIVGIGYTLSGPYLIPHAVMWTWDPGTSDVTADSGVEGRLRVYPNPLADQSRVSFLLPSREAGALRLFDVAGRQVRGWTVTSETQRFETDLSASGQSLPNGVYRLEWSGNHSGSTRSTRVVVTTR